MATINKNTSRPKSKRFEAELPVDSKAVSALIGRAGSNTRRICKLAGHGTYIRAYSAAQGVKVRVRLSECDTIHIESYSEEGVRKAATILKQDEAAILTGSAPSRPQKLVPCNGADSKAIGTIIGSKGSNIRALEKFVGDGCYIVHKPDQGGFVVTCDSQRALAVAESKIEAAIKNYHEEQKKWHKHPQRRTGGGGGGTTSHHSNNSFGAFLDDSSDESGDESGEDRATSTKKEYRSSLEARLRRQQDSHETRKKAYLMEGLKRNLQKGYSRGGIGSRKKEQFDRWRVREELSKKTNPSTGAKLYGDYEFFTKAGRRIRCNGVSAVPWPEVDKEIARRQKGEDAELEKARGMAAKKRQQLAQNGLAEELESVESFPKLPARKKVEQAVAQSKVLTQCPNLAAALGDLASEQSYQKKTSCWGGGGTRHLKMDEEGEEELVRQKKVVMLEKISASKMVRLGSLQKPRVESPVAEGPTKIDLSYLSKPKRNVTLKVVSKPKPSWADMAEEDDAYDFYDEDDKLNDGW